MYGGQSHGARSSTEVVLDHHCPLCGAVSQGVAIGWGAGQSGGFDASQSEAIAKARQNSQIDAARAMKLARCPKCNRRDPGEVRAFLIRSLAFGVALGVFFGFLGFAGGVALSTAGALGGVGIGLGRFWWKVTQSDKRVSFDAPGP
jgi:hypothetical protein